MAISPPSDLIIDVARAADPSAVRAARDRLSRLGYADAIEQSSITRTDTAAKKASAPSWEEQARQAQLSRPARSGNSSVVSAPEAGTPAQARKKLDPYAQFEAFVLQSFIQEMLPSDASSVYGTGTAGQIWRSMLAQNMATEIARTGGVGIAERVRGPAEARSHEDGNAPESAAGALAPQASDVLPAGTATMSNSASDQLPGPADVPSAIWPTAIVKPT